MRLFVLQLLVAASLLLHVSHAANVTIDAGDDWGFSMEETAPFANQALPTGLAVCSLSCSPNKLVSYVFFDLSQTRHIYASAIESVTYHVVVGSISPTYSLYPYPSELNCLINPPTVNEFFNAAICTYDGIDEGTQTLNAITVPGVGSSDLDEYDAGPGYGPTVGVAANLDVSTLELTANVTTAFVAYRSSERFPYFVIRPEVTGGTSVNLFLNTAFLRVTHNTARPQVSSVKVVLSNSVPVDSSAPFEFSFNGQTTELAVEVTFSTAIRNNLADYPFSRTDSALVGDLFSFKRPEPDNTPLDDAVYVDPLTFVIDPTNNAIVRFTVRPVSAFPQLVWYIVLNSGFQSQGYDDSFETNIVLSVDTIPPKLTSITPVNPGKQGSRFRVHVNFDGPIVVPVTESDFSLCLTQTTLFSWTRTYIAAGLDYLEYDVTLTQEADSTMDFFFDTTTCAGYVQDIVGNPFVLADTVSPRSVDFDSKPPSIDHYVIDEDSNGQVACGFTFTVTWSEPLAGGSAPRMLVTNTEKSTSDVLIPTTAETTETTSVYTYTASGTICGSGADRVAAALVIISLDDSDTTRDPYNNLRYDPVSQESATTTLDTMPPSVVSIKFGPDFENPLTSNSHVGRGVMIEFAFDDIVAPVFQYSFDNTAEPPTTTDGTKWYLTLDNSMPEGLFSITIVQETGETVGTVDNVGNAMESILPFPLDLVGDLTAPNLTFTIKTGSGDVQTHLNADSRTVEVLYSETPNVNTFLEAGDLRFGLPANASAYSIADTVISQGNLFTFTLKGLSLLQANADDKADWYLFAPADRVVDRVVAGSPNYRDTAAATLNPVVSDFVKPTITGFAIQQTGVSDRRVKNDFLFQIDFSEPVQGLVPGLFVVGEEVSGSFQELNSEFYTITHEQYDNEQFLPTWLFKVHLETPGDEFPVAIRLACTADEITDDLYNHFDCNSQTTGYKTYDNTNPAFVAWSYSHPALGEETLATTVGFIAANGASAERVFPWYAAQDVRSRVVSFFLEVDSEDTYEFAEPQVETEASGISVTFGANRVWGSKGQINVAVPEEVTADFTVSVVSLTDTAGNVYYFEEPDKLVVSIDTRSPYLSSFGSQFTNANDAISAVLITPTSFSTSQLSDRLQLDGTVLASTYDPINSKFDVTGSADDGVYTATLGVVYPSVTACPSESFTTLPALVSSTYSIVVAGRTTGAEFASVCEQTPSFTVKYRVIGTGAIMTASTCGKSDITNPVISVVLLRDCDLRCVVTTATPCVSGGVSVEWESQAGVEYLVAVHSSEPSSGDFQLTISSSAFTPESEILDSAYNRFRFFTKLNFIVDRTDPVFEVFNTHVRQRDDPTQEATPDLLMTPSSCDANVIGKITTFKLQIGADAFPYAGFSNNAFAVTIAEDLGAPVDVDSSLIVRSTDPSIWTISLYNFSDEFSVATRATLSVTLTDAHGNFATMSCGFDVDSAAPTIGAVVFTPAATDGFLKADLTEGLRVDIPATAVDVVAFGSVSITLSDSDEVGISCIPENIVYPADYCRAPECTLTFRLRAGAACPDLDSFQGSLKITYTSRDIYYNDFTEVLVFDYDSVAPSDIIFTPASGEYISVGDRIQLIFLPDENITISSTSVEAVFTMYRPGLAQYPLSSVAPDISSPRISSSPTDPDVGTVEFDSSDALFDGSWTLHVTATDSASNRGNSRTATYELDATSLMAFVASEPNMGIGRYYPCVGLRGTYESGSSSKVITSNLALGLSGTNSLTVAEGEAFLYFPAAGVYKFQVYFNGDATLSLKLGEATWSFESTEALPVNTLLMTDTDATTVTVGVSGFTLPFSFTWASTGAQSQMELIWLRGNKWEVIPHWALRTRASCPVNLQGEVIVALTENAYIDAAPSQLAVGLNNPEDTSPLYTNDDVFASPAVVSDFPTSLTFGDQVSGVLPDFTLYSRGVAADAEGNILASGALATIPVDLDPPSCDWWTTTGPLPAGSVILANDLTMNVDLKCLEAIPRWVTSTASGNDDVGDWFTSEDVVITSGAGAGLHTSVSQPDDSSLRTGLTFTDEYLTSLGSTSPIEVSVTISAHAVRDLAGNAISIPATISFSVDYFNPRVVDSTIQPFYGASGSFSVSYSELIQESGVSASVNEASCSITSISVDGVDGVAAAVSVGFSCSPGARYPLEFSILGVKDLSGRSAAVEVLYTVSDSERPTVRWITAGTAIGSSGILRVQFSEDIPNIVEYTPFSLDVDTSICEVTNYVPVPSVAGDPLNGPVYEVYVACYSGYQGTFTVSANAALADVFDNALTGNLDSDTFTFDSVPPSIILVSLKSGSRDPSTVFGVGASTLTVQFSEAVTGPISESFKCELNDGSGDVLPLTYVSTGTAPNSYRWTVDTSGIPVGTDNPSYVTCFCSGRENIRDNLFNVLDFSGTTEFGAMTELVPVPTMSAVLASPFFVNFNSTIRVRVTFDRDMDTASVAGAPTLVVPPPSQNAATSSTPVTIDFLGPTVVVEDARNFVYTITTNPLAGLFSLNLLSIEIRSQRIASVFDDLGNPLDSTDFPRLSGSLDLRRVLARAGSTTPSTTWGRTKVYDLLFDEIMYLPAISYTPTGAYDAANSDIRVVVTTGDPACLLNVTVAPVGTTSDTFTVSPTWGVCRVAFAIRLSPQFSDLAGNSAGPQVSTSAFIYTMDGFPPALEAVFADTTRSDPAGIRQYDGSQTLPRIVPVFSINLRFDELLNSATVALSDFSIVYSGGSATCIIASTATWTTGKTAVVLSCSVTPTTEGILTVTPTGGSFTDAVTPPNAFNSEVIVGTTRVSGAAFSWFVDAISPTITSSSPNRVSNQATYDTVTINWSEDIASASCSKFNVMLELDGELISHPSDISCTASTWTITLSNVPELVDSPGGNLRVGFTTAVEDLVGNAVTNQYVLLVWDNVGASVTVTPLSLSPSQEDVNDNRYLLPRTFSIDISFSDPVILPSAQESSYTYLFNFDCGGSACPTSEFAVSSYVCVSPVDTLCSQVVYTFVVNDIDPQPDPDMDIPIFNIGFPSSASYFQDGVGNNLVGTFTFNTKVDSTPPLVDFNDPDASDAIPLVASFVFIFSEPVRPPADTTLRLLIQPDTTPVDIAVSVSGRSDVWAMSVFLPDGYNRNELLTAVLADIRDLAGNVIVDYRIVDLRVDYTVPYLVSTSPAIGTGFRPNAVHEITFTFSEEIAQPIAANFRVLANGFISNNNLTNLAFTPGSRDVTLSLNLTGVSETSDFRIVVIGGTVKDLSGNGVPQTTALFSIDNTPPSVDINGILPANNENVPGVFVANISFSEPVFFGTTTVQATVCDTPRSFSVIDSPVFSQHHAFEIDFSDLTSCADGNTLSLDIPAVYDVTRELSTDPTTITYTLLREAPQLEGIIIVGREYSDTLGIRESLNFTFNKAVRFIGQGPSVIISQEDVETTGAQIVSVSQSPNSKSVFVELRLFRSDSDFTVTLPSEDGWADFAGNFIQASSWTGAVDTAAPVILTSTPASGAFVQSTFDLTILWDERPGMSYAGGMEQDCGLEGSTCTYVGVPGGSIVTVSSIDLYGNGALYSLNFRVDDTAPTVSWTPSSASTVFGAATTFDLVFSETVTGFTATCTDESVSVEGTLNSNGFTGTLAVNVDPAVDGVCDIQLSFPDLAGNTGSATINFAYETRAPAFSASVSNIDGFVGASFSVAVSLVDFPTLPGTVDLERARTGAVSVSNGASVTSVITVSANSLVYLVEATTEGLTTVSFTANRFVDLRGNGLSEPPANIDVTVDTTGPVVSILQPVAESRVGPRSRRITFTVTDGSGVGVDLSTVNLIRVSSTQAFNMTTPLTVATADGTTTAWFEATWTNYDGPVTITVSGIKDRLGNVAANAEQSFYVSQTALSLSFAPSISALAISADAGVGRYTPGITVTVTFSEPPAEFTNAYVTANGVSLSTVQPVAETTTQFTFDISDALDGVRTISIANVTAAETTNGLFGVTSFTFMVDQTRPTVSLASPAESVVVSRVVYAEVDFSESVTVTLSDLSAVNGTVASITPLTQLNGHRYLIRVNVDNGVSSVSLTVSQNVYDAYGNTMAADQTFSWSVDQQAPSAALVTPDPASPFVQDITTVTIALSDDINITTAGLVPGALTMYEGATLRATAADVEYIQNTGALTATFTFANGFQAPEGNMILRLAEQRDIAGNVISAQSWSFFVDRTAPSYTIAMYKADGNNMGMSSSIVGRNAYIVVSLSEPIDISDLERAFVDSGSQNDATFSVSSTFEDGSLTTRIFYRVEQLSDAVPVVTFGFNTAGLADRAGNAFASFPTVEVIVDTTAPIVTLTPQYSSPADVIASASYLLPVSFSEAVLFGSNVLTASQGTVGTLARVGASNAFRFPISGLSDGPVTFTVSTSGSICDLYENCISETTFAWTVDLTAPLVVSTTPATGAYVNSGSVSVDVAFSEDVSVASLSFRRMSGTTPVVISAANPTLLSSTASFPATALVDAVYTATVEITDMYGNSASYSWVFTVDTVAPTCSVDSAIPSASGVVNAAPAFTITCSEVLASIPTVTGAGTVSSAGGNSYTFSFSGLVDGSTLSLDIDATDLATNTRTSSFTYVVDDVAPFDAGTPDSETYSVPSGSRVFPIRFSEPVVLSGTPFSVSQGVVDRYTAVDAANYELVVSGLTEGSLVITIGGGSSITDRVLNAMTQITKSYTIDNTAPFVTNVTVSSWFAPDWLTATSQIVVVTFSEPTAITPSQVFFTLPPSTSPITGTQDSASPCTVCQFTFTGLPQGRVVLQVSGFADRYGNVQLTPYQQTNRVDTVAPSVSSVTVAPVYSTNNVGAVATFTVTFSESMASFVGASHMTFTGTTPSSVTTTGSGSVFTVVASGLSANFALGFTSGAVDPANNGLAAFTPMNFVVDVVKPTLTAAQFSGVALNSSVFTIAGTTLLFDVTFSEPVKDLALTDIAITTGAGSVSAVARIANDPTRWAVTIADVAEGPYVVSVSPAGSQIKDRVDNTLDTVSLTWTVDKTAPSLLIAETPASGTTVSARPFSLVLVFNERIVPLTNTDVTYVQTAVGITPAVNANAASVANVWNGVNHTFTITAPAVLRDGTVTVSVANIRDVQTNARQALAFTYVLDFTGPVAAVSVVAPAFGVLSSSGRVQVTFNEDIPAFQGSNVVLSAGEVGSVFTTIAGRQFQFDVSGLTGMTPLTVQFTGITDMFGNAVGSTTYDLLVDAVVPTIAAVAPVPELTYNGANFQASFTPSEPVSWGANSAVATLDGNAAQPTQVTVSMNTLVLRWNSVPTGLLVVTLNQDNSVKDIADNLLAVVSYNFTIDNVVPTTNDAFVTPAPGSFLRPGDNITIVFSEALDASTVFASSVKFAGAVGSPVSASAVVGSGNTWSWTVPDITDGPYTMMVAGVSDLVGNLLAPYSAPYIVDLTPAVATASIATGNVVGVTANVTVSFSEPVVMIYPQNVTCNNGIVSAVSSTVDPRVWIVRVVNINQTVSSWMNMSVVSSDVSRRQPRTVGPFSFIVDTTGPVVTSFAPNATVGPINDQVRVLFSLDEQVSPVTAGAITATVAGVATSVGPVTALGGNSYSVDVVAPNGAVVVTFTNAIRDILGNAHRGSTFSFNVDGVRPRASSIQDGSSFTDAEFQINVVFSERVQNVDSTDFAVSAGSGVVAVINVTATDAVLRVTRAARGELKISTSLNNDIVDMVGNPIVPVAFTFMIAPAAADPAAVKITPIIECIQQLENNQYEVFFGYNSLEQVPVTVSVLSTFNTFTGTLEGNPETLFEPGRAVLAFSARWNGVAGSSWRLGNFRVDVPAFSPAIACPSTVTLSIESADPLTAEQLAALRRALAEVGQVPVEGISLTGGSKKRGIMATYQALVNSTSAAASITNAAPSQIQTAFSNNGVPSSVSSDISADTTGLGLATGGSVIPPVAPPQEVSGSVVVSGASIAGIVIGVLIAGLIIGGIIAFVVLRVIRKKDSQQGKEGANAFDSKKAQKDTKSEPKTAAPAPVPAPVAEKKEKKKPAAAPVVEESSSSDYSRGRSKSRSQSHSRTPSRSRSPSQSRSRSPSRSPSRSDSRSPSRSRSASRSPSQSGSRSPSRSRSASRSDSGSRSPSSSRSRSPSPSRSEEASGEVNFDNNDN